MPTRVISITNHKGGVGKTTTTLNLGKALALAGQRVLLIDIDPQSNLSQHVGVEDPEQSVYDTLCDNAPLPVRELEPGLSLVPSDLSLSTAETRLVGAVTGYFRLRNALKPIEDRYDFVLIDCPPSLGVLTVNAMMAATEVLIVAEAQYFSVKGLNTILTMVGELQNTMHNHLRILGMVITQTNRTVLSKMMAEAIQQNYQGRVFQTVVRQSAALAEASLSKKDIFQYSPRSTGAEDYQQLAQEVING
ncbi:MAG: ParA family protein [Bernardetiaceae bacterium]|jgi:chromosome partitioning protein|nr:ParA family protein [Bernardetiaceae bacterium]